MSAGVAGPDLDDQVERTLLAWRRTALSLVAAGPLVGHLAVGDAGRPILVLVAGVVLIGAMALVSLVAR